MTPEKQDKTLELSKHWSADSTPARNEVIMKRKKYMLYLMILKGMAHPLNRLKGLEEMRIHHHMVTNLLITIKKP